MKKALQFNIHQAFLIAKIALIFLFFILCCSITAKSEILWFTIDLEIAYWQDHFFSNRVIGINILNSTNILDET